VKQWEKTMADEGAAKKDGAPCGEHGEGIWVGGVCMYRVEEANLLAQRCTDGQPCGYNNEGRCVQGECRYSLAAVMKHHLTIKRP
jgi:hypothetical protein